MLQVLITLIYCLLFGIGIGGMLLNKRNVVSHSQIALFTICFGFLAYIGMVLGSFLFATASIRLIEILFSMMLIVVLIIAIFKQHPYFGYFHENSKELIWLMFLLFLFTGIEWTVLQLTYFMTIFGSIVFFGAILLGMMIQAKIMEKAWRVQLITLVPIVWFVVIVVIKLI